MYINFRGLCHLLWAIIYDTWHQSINVSSIEILIKINLEKAFNNKWLYKKGNWPVQKFTTENWIDMIFLILKNILRKWYKMYR